MHLKGKQIKDYLLGDTIASCNDMHLLAGTKKNGQEVSILVIEKKKMQQETFVPYNNLLVENKDRIHPQYIEAVQSANNIYIIIQKVNRVTCETCHFLKMLPSFVELYRTMGEYKLQEGEVFVNTNGKILYMPFYKRLQITSKFYAQFHNKSVLGDLFSSLVPIANKNLALNIFIKNIDSPHAADAIAAQLSKELQLQGKKDILQSKQSYPSLQNDDDDEQIMQLMSKVKVNSDMKKEAGQQFMRLSAKREDQGENNKEIVHIMDNVESSMFHIKNIKSSKTDKTKLQIKLNKSKVQLNSFDLYFRSYFQSLRFLKKSIKVFLSYYKNGFAGIISSFLMVLVITLRKVYMIKALLQREDIFELGIDMSTIPVHKYEAILKHEMKSETKMLAEFKSVLETCSMPMKTYTILAPYLEDDISIIDFDQLHTFAFFFLSALLKSKDIKNIHFLHVIEVMYILLHRNYEIVFFEDDFPRKWDEEYFNTKVALIQAIIPTWNYP